MPDKDTPPTRKKRHTRKFKKRFLLIPLLAIILFGVYYFVSLYNTANQIVTDSYEDAGRDKSDLRDQAVDPNIHNVSVLIIGVDTSEHRKDQGNPRSDTLMLATLNQKEKSVKLVSIPRDSYVYIPEVGYETKINHAHAYGGVKATIDTVENLFDIPVDYFVKMNFEAFVDVVDAIDGIKVNVPYEFYESNSQDVKGAIHLMPGEQTLNGEEALALARTRKLDNDIERGKRQQEIIKAIVKKSVSLGSFFKLDNVIQAVGGNMTTNMTFDEMKSFVSYGIGGNELDIETYTLVGYDSQPAGIFYYMLDQAALEETKAMLRAHLEL
ncbi:LCP family protein [Ornithinibacillus halotolerans]|uniref:LytR family transcriptional regulator n=1 Tax=Ornithinibacillus halotolerans TaxID=1274357 RepID=A0A916RQW0_9BACI|nr:LCP family protein [Ornithinibacillus halotolerans]GGA64891.1 LytR family transcriptional regulator [Ornithinibacillus halotolerans]